MCATTPHTTTCQLMGNAGEVCVTGEAGENSTMTGATSQGKPANKRKPPAMCTLQRLHQGLLAGTLPRSP